MEKLNIAEILKDCPTGMELDCTMFDNATFMRVDSSRRQFPIEIAISGQRSKYLTKEGCFHDNTLCPEAKCVIFPKGKTTWEGFQRPFKDGDILATDLGSVFYLNKRLNTDECYGCYVGIGGDGSFHICVPFAYKECCGLATEEEKQKLFKAIRNNGYRWNPETKTLEKLLKFKVGDRITNGKVSITIGYIDDNYYYEVGRNIANRLFIKNQDDWRLDKFDITTLKPFESMVLVRSSMDGLWKPAVFGFRNGYNDNAFYIVGGSCWKQCIPYLNNEHLCGTTNDCDDYYKTWE